MGLLVILEVLVVGEDSDGVGGVCKEVSPVVKTPDDSKEFLVMNIVVTLGFVKCF